jgi:HlyD family secretion protein
MPLPSIPIGAVALVAVLLGACGDRQGALVMSGYAEADLIYLAPPFAGRLLSLTVQRGDAVAKGQPLFELDTASEAIASDAAVARLDHAGAALANLRKGKRPNELQAIEQQLAQAQAGLRSSESLLARNRQLVAQGFLAPVQLDELSAVRDRDAARVRELQAQRASALDAARSDEIAAAEADTRGSSADLAQARWRQAQQQRTAPVDAQVVDVMYRVGEWVAAGAPVLSLLPPGAVKVRFFVPQPELSRVAVGQSVALACDGCPAGWTAHISFISPQAEYTPPVIYSNQSRDKLVFLAEAVPEGAARAQLKPGQPVDVRLAAPAVKSGG